MPIIDILGGVTGGAGSSSGSGSSGSGGGFTTLLNNALTGGIGGLINSILGAFGNIACIGGSGYDQADFDREKNYLTEIITNMLNHPDDMPNCQHALNQFVVVRDQKIRHLGNVVNPCTKQRMNQMIDLTNAQIAKFHDWFYLDNQNYITITQWGDTYNVDRIVGYKTVPSNTTTPPITYPPTTPPVTTPPTTYPPVTYPPTTPPVVNPPVNYPPVTYPDTTTPPVTYPPVTYPDTTTPPVNYPPVTTTTGNTSNTSGGITRTQTTHPDGSMTIYLWNPDGTLFKTTNIPAPNVGGGSMTSNLDGNIDISGNVGDWNFGLNNNKDQTLYIAGGLGLLGLIAFMAKSKK